MSVCVQERDTQGREWERETNKRVKDRGAIFLATPSSGSFGSLILAACTAATTCIMTLDENEEGYEITSQKCFSIRTSEKHALTPRHQYDTQKESRSFNLSGYIWRVREGEKGKTLQSKRGRRLC